MDGFMGARAIEQNLAFQVLDDHAWKLPQFVHVCLAKSSLPGKTPIAPPNLFSNMTALIGPLKTVMRCVADLRDQGDQFAR
jgi:hypothetical protein